ncbi:phosphotransferase [Candidatus Pelagibacter communis]|uniref:phosphotransferase n=1 Tax=Pelagibacter ubique TaxID=198252 RepID=UPI000A6CD7F8|nr:phosphotransferase [Candidatus Pelagibacter ubique]
MNFKKIKGDASDREFYRSRNSILVYSKKNKYKNLLVYDCINKILNNHKILAPKLIKNNYDESSIQITDLGKKSVKNILKKNNRYKIYKKIIDILIKFKKIKNIKTINLNGKQYCMKKYNHKELYKEADLFNKWYTPYYNRKLAKPYKKKKIRKIINILIKKIKLPNNTFVHRDFHVSNMMYKNKKIYLIDSQDAVIGNPAYDLASLIDDVRYKSSNLLKKKIYSYFLQKSKKIDRKSFQNDFLILSVLRNLKILGIFTRLAKRDKKNNYLKLIPYTWKLIKLRTSGNIIFDELVSCLNNEK